MEDSFAAQKRYFQIQIDRCQNVPHLHKNKIKDCTHYLKVLAETGSPAAFKKYVQQSGNMLSTAKAEARDRYENRSLIYRKLGLKKKEIADDLRLKAIDQAQTHQQLARELENIENKAQPLEQEENKAIMAATRIVQALFHLATDPPGSKARQLSASNFHEYWKQIREADPEISWNKLTTYPPYRSRMIFTGAQLDVLKQVFEEVTHGSHG
jgi:hypothetical protein